MSDDAEIQRLREVVQMIVGQLRAAQAEIATMKGEIAERSVAYGIELKRQLLINERLSRADAELAHALGGRLVEVAPPPKPRRKPVRLVVDNDRPPDGER
jgi:hypothetical protein